MLTDKSKLTKSPWIGHVSGKEYPYSLKSYSNSYLVLSYIAHHGEVTEAQIQSNVTVFTKGHTIDPFDEYMKLLISHGFVSEGRKSIEKWIADHSDPNESVVRKVTKYISVYQPTRLCKEIALPYINKGDLSFGLLF